MTHADYLHLYHMTSTAAVLLGLLLYLIFVVLLCLLMFKGMR